MALFGWGSKEKDKSAGAPVSQTRPVMGRSAFCRVCGSHQVFTRCWVRADPVRQCGCCGFTFPDPALLYTRTQPVCPQCGEYLEQPGFEYGTCDGCGSKFELVPNTKPSLLPNQAQRAEMAKHGKAWRYD